MRDLQKHALRKGIYFLEFSSLTTTFLTMPKSILFLIILLPLFSPAQTQKEGAFERGRTFTRWITEGQTDSLYQVMSAEFRNAVGGKEGLQRLAQQLTAQAGKEVKVLQEEAFLEAGHISYYRISNFERLPDATAHWVWDSTGILIGATITPTPQPAESNKLDYKTQAPLQLPFKGQWYVAWGGRTPMLNYHVTTPDQRFAYDFVKVQGNRFFRNRGASNEDYFSWQQPVYAPAAGKVVVAVDSVADNVPGEKNSRVPPGNHIIIDHGNGEYSLLAHFKKGSLKVKKGQQVKEGELLGLTGNSGNSSMPHLHYHLQTGAAYNAGLGLPAPFQKYTSGGRYVAEGEPVRGEYVTPYEGEKK